VTPFRTVVVAATAVLVAACSAPSPPPPVAPPAPAPVSLYTLEKPEHRVPVSIAWHAESGAFFAGTHYDGSIYRGTPSGSTTWRRGPGAFDTGPGGHLHGLHVADSGDVWVTDNTRPVLWHLTPEQVAAGSGTPASIPLSPEIPLVSGPDNVEGVVAVSDTRLVVVKYADGTLYRIDLDPQVPEGRTITPIAGATVPLGSRMTLDGNRLVVPDENGVSVVELSDDAARGTVVAQLRDPSFHNATAVVRVGDRYLVVNASWNDPPPYTVASVPAVG